MTRDFSRHAATGGNHGSVDTGAEPAAAHGFLDEPATRYLMSHLNGVEDVTVRMMGPHPKEESEVVGFLSDAGFSVTSQVLERMVPPPLTRFALRYQGRHAVLTVAPDVKG